MDLQTFANLASFDQKVGNEARNIINEAQNNPSFVSYLLNTLLTPESQADPKIFQLILIVLVDTARNHVNNFITATNDQQVKQTLIQILFSIPLEYRPHIEECLILAAPSAEIEFSAIFQTIFEKIKPHSNIADIFTAISFANEWIKKSLPADFFTNFSQIIHPFLQACAQGEQMDELRAKTISELAKLSETLISRGNIIFNNSFDSLFSTFCSFLVQPLQTESGLKMKTSITQLLSKVIYFVYHQLKSKPETTEWRQNFITTVVPGIFQSAMQACSQPMDSQLIQHLFHLFYFFISFEIEPQQILTPDFFKGIVIPSARLVDNDLVDYESNPIHYILFCCEHEDIGFFSPRVCASQFLNIALTKYRNFFDPLLLLLPQQEQNENGQPDLIDFEARLYLLQRYTMCCELPYDIFEKFFNMLTQDHPLFIVSALIRLVTIPMSSGDNSVVGISVAEHFIINSVDKVVQMMAIRFMNECFTKFGIDKLGELNGIIELNTNALFPILLNLSNSLNLPDPMILIENIFKIGPQNYMNIVTDLIQHFFALWRENQATLESAEDEIEDNSYQIMESLTTILETVPSDSELIKSLSISVLQQLGKDMTEFPNNSSISNQIRVAAVFSRKLSVPIEAQISFISLIIQMNLDPSDIVDNFVLLVCPLIVNNNNFNFYQFNLQEYLITFCQSILKLDDDPDDNSISQCLVLASCMIQTKGEEYFPFVTSAIQILLSRPVEPVAFFGAIYVFASALFVDATKAQILFIAEVPDLICEMAHSCCVSENNVAAYREIKMTVSVLTWFAKFGHQRSFTVASSLFKPLLDMKALDETIEITPDTLLTRANLHREEELISLSPLIRMPFDSFDELNFFMEFSAQSGMIGSIPGGFEGLLSPSGQ